MHQQIWQNPTLQSEQIPSETRHCFSRNSRQWQVYIRTFRRKGSKATHLKILSQNPITIADLYLNVFVLQILCKLKSGLE